MMFPYHIGSYILILLQKSFPDVSVSFMWNNLPI
jgi:hypothetical protein